MDDIEGDLLGRDVRAPARPAGRGVDRTQISPAARSAASPPNVMTSVAEGRSETAPWRRASAASERKATERAPSGQPP